MEVTAGALDVGLFFYSQRGRDRHRRFVNLQSSVGVRRCNPSRRPTWPRSPLEQKEGRTPLPLGDVADVVINTWPLVGDAVINCRPGLHARGGKVSLGAIRLKPTNGVEAAITELRPGLPGVSDRPDHLPSGRFYSGGAP